MIRAGSVVLVVALVLLPTFCVGQSAMPIVSSVEPNFVMVHEAFTIKGQNLSKKLVAELFLTNGRDDFPLKATSQTDTEIQTRVPDTLKPGRYRVMLLTSGADPKLIEQPVKVQVETAEQRKERQEAEAEMKKSLESQPPPAEAKPAP